MSKKPHSGKKSHEKMSKSAKQVRQDKCVQPAILAILKAATTERPPTPTPGSSPSTFHGRLDPLLAPVYVPNKTTSGTRSHTQITRHGHPVHRHSSTKLNPLNPITKAESKFSNLADTYRSGKVDLSGSLPAVEQIPLAQFSSEEMRTNKKASFLPKIEQSSKHNLTGAKYGSFHALTHYEYQKHGFKRSPIEFSPKLTANDVKLPPAKSKQLNIIYKRSGLAPDSFSSGSPSSSPGETLTGELIPKPPTEGRTKKHHHSRKHRMRRKSDADETGHRDMEN